MGRFTHQHRVSWPEVELAGVVYFAHFINYFEAAEAEWVRSHGIEYGEMLERFGICMPRASIHCDYHAPARLDDLLDLEVRRGRLGATSFTLAFEIFAEPENRCLADGTFVIVTVSRSTFRPVRIPDRLREMLETLNVAE